MQPNEVGIQYMMPSNTSLYQYIPSMPCNTASPFQMNGQYFHNIHIVPQDFNPQQSSLSSNSTSDEADEQQQSIINERKQRRMISNRESARRSRMRKQRHLDELWSQVLWLRNENHHLIDKLNDVSDSHDRVVKENVVLKEQTAELRRLVTDLQLNSTYSALKDLEEIADVTYLAEESSD
ncbi:Basic leucine zipper 43-like protein [Drosera capensis]